MIEEATLTDLQKDVIDRARKALDWTTFDNHFPRVEASTLEHSIRLYCADDCVTGAVLSSLIKVAGHTFAVTKDVDGDVYILMN